MLYHVRVGACVGCHTNHRLVNVQVLPGEGSIKHRVGGGSLDPVKYQGDERHLQDLPAVKTIMVGCMALNLSFYNAISSNINST